MTDTSYTDDDPRESVGERSVSRGRLDHGNGRITDVVPAGGSR